MKSFKSVFAYFVTPFICDIEDGFPISEIILTEKAAEELNLIEMNEDQALQRLQKASMTEFWKPLPESKYPNFKKVTCLFSIFGTTYCWKSFYSTVKFVKSKRHSQLTNQHLTEFLQTTLTNFKPNFKNLTKNCR